MPELLGVYAAKHKDADIRAASRSGGFFTALSDYVLENDGIVYGCVLSNDFEAYHTRAVNSAERDEMRGSKYIQSKMGNCFDEVKNDLEHGKEVLFSGTSCQVDGLKKYLGKNYDNLLCLDIVCFGVSSPEIWKAFLDWQEKRLNKKIIAVDFRNKSDFGWKKHVETLYTLDGMGINSTIFRELFLGKNIIRPSCYECKYKSIFHPGDITVGDYWGIDDIAPGFNDDKGVSLVLINSSKGERCFRSIQSKFDTISTNINVSMQPSLIQPYDKPTERDSFWDDYKSYGFEYIARKFGGYKTRYKRFIERISNIVKRGWLCMKEKDKT